LNYWYFNLQNIPLRIKNPCLSFGSTRNSWIESMEAMLSSELALADR